MKRWVYEKVVLCEEREVCASGLAVQNLMDGECEREGMTEVAKRVGIHGRMFCFPSVCIR